MSKQRYRLILFTIFLVIACYFLGHDVATDFLDAAPDDGLPNMWYGMIELSWILFSSALLAGFGYMAVGRKFAITSALAGLFIQFWALFYPKSMVAFESGDILSFIAIGIFAYFMVRLIYCWTTSISAEGEEKHSRQSANAGIA